MTNQDLKFIVDELKIRLDKYLAGQLREISRSKIQKDIAEGRVLVNGKKVLESKFVVREGGNVVYHYKKGNKKLTATEIPLKILYNKDGLLIIDKPAGLAVHPGAGFKGETLAAALLYHFKDIKSVGQQDRPGIVHRLDKNTSGVMLIATTQAIYEYLKDAFAQKKIKKEYLALVLGKIEEPYGFMDLAIGRSKTDFRKYASTNIIKPKQALTEYRVLEYLSDGLDQYTLVRVQLHTGRTHQIRVHFNSIGHPLMGDSLYGGKKTHLGGLNRQFLHAKKIEVQLSDKIWIEAESELAEDLREVLKRLNSKIVNQL